MSTIISRCILVQKSFKPLPLGVAHIIAIAESLNQYFICEHLEVHYCFESLYDGF